MVLLGAVSYTQMTALQGNVIDQGTNWLPATRALVRMEYFAARGRGALLGEVLHAKTAQDLAAAEKILSSHQEKFDEQAKLYEATITGADEAAVWDKVKSARALSQSLVEEVIGAIGRGDDR